MQRALHIAHGLQTCLNTSLEYFEGRRSRDDLTEFTDPLLQVVMGLFPPECHLVVRIRVNLTENPHRLSELLEEVTGVSLSGVDDELTAISDIRASEPFYKTIWPFLKPLVTDAGNFPYEENIDGLIQFYDDFVTVVTTAVRCVRQEASHELIAKLTYHICTALCMWSIFESNVDHDDHKSISSVSSMEQILDKIVHPAFPPKTKIDVQWIYECFQQKYLYCVSHVEFLRVFVMICKCQCAAFEHDNLSEFADAHRLCTLGFYPSMTELLELSQKADPYDHYELLSEKVIELHYRLIESRCQRCNEKFENVKTDDVLLPEYMRKFVQILSCQCYAGKFDHMLPKGNSNRRFRCHRTPIVRRERRSAKIDVATTKMSMIEAVTRLGLKKKDAQSFVEKINAIHSQKDADETLCTMRQISSENKFLERTCLLNFRAQNHQNDALRESVRLALIEVIACEEKTRTMDVVEVASLCYSMKQELLLDEHSSRLIYRISEGAETPLIEFSAWLYAQKVLQKQSCTVSVYSVASKLVLSDPSPSSNHDVYKRMYLLSLCNQCLTRRFESTLHVIALNVIKSSEDPTPESLSVLTKASQFTLQIREMPKISTEGDMMIQADSETKFVKHKNNLEIMKQQLNMKLIALESATFDQMVPLLTCAVKDLMGPLV